MWCPPLFLLWPTLFFIRELGIVAEFVVVL